MSRLHLLVPITLLFGACAQAPLSGAAPLHLRFDEPESVASVVEVDSARWQVVFLAGPFRLAPHVGGHAPGYGATNAPGCGNAHAHGYGNACEHGHGGGSGAVDSSYSTHGLSPLFEFEWPVDGWVRGFSWTLVGRDGDPLPSTLLHYLGAVNFDRRQLAVGAAERLFAADRETRRRPLARLRRSARSRQPTQHPGLLAQRLRAGDLRSIPARGDALAPGRGGSSKRNPAVLAGGDQRDRGCHRLRPAAGPLDSLPRVRRAVRGTIVGAGGHLHGFGLLVRLEDTETGQVLLSLCGSHDRAGRLVGVERKVFPPFRRAPRRHASRRYRVVGEYGNPTSMTLAEGGMAHIAAIFQPADMRAWPGVDPASELYRRDLAGLPGAAGRWLGPRSNRTGVR